MVLEEDRKMNDEQRAKAHKILEHYGDDVERAKAIEELGELITAIARGSRRNIVEEMADVLICLEHISYICNISKEELDCFIDFKLNREIGRVWEAQSYLMH